MLIKKTEENGVSNCLYESSNLVASIFDKNSKDLSIIFGNGTKYTYSNVSTVDYLAFEMADSQGKFLNSNIKKYSVVKNDPVDIEEFKKQILEVRKVDELNLKLGIINRFKDVVNRFENHDTFDEAGIDIAITLYNKFKNG